jgi:hypothetical protein
MDSQKIAGVLAALIGLVVFAVAFAYMPKKGADAAKQQAEKQRVELPKAPIAPPVRGPVVRDITPEK